jgi:hypothetical protein
MENGINGDQDLMEVIEVNGELTTIHDNEAYGMIKAGPLEGNEETLQDGPLRCDAVK